ncbi:hypothetical protein K2W90_03275 [Candidatus Babeliales bacterium]|nr:hypothetical protein [Candidatus Babeliales bacterium]
MKTIYSKIILLSITSLTLQVAHAEEGITRLSPTDRSIYEKNIQIGKNDQNKNRRDLEVTRETFCRGKVVVGSGSNVDIENNRNCGCNRTIVDLDFNPNTQLLCIEFCNSNADTNGAWLNINFCGKAIPRKNQCYLDPIIPISSTYTRLFVSSSDPADDSYLWANSTVIRDDQGNDNCPDGTCLYNFRFTRAQYPYIPTPNTPSTKVYIGLYDNDSSDYAFYLKNCYDYIFLKGCLFVDAVSCQIRHISVVNIPQHIFSFEQILQNKIINIVCNQEGSNVFQAFGVGKKIAETQDLATTLTNLLLGSATQVQNACNQILALWQELYIVVT